MPFSVQLTADAARDLEDIYHDISQRHSPDDAVDVLERIERAFCGLADHPHCGSYPRNSSTSAYASAARSSSSHTGSSTA